MSWITAIWSAAAGICLTLAGVHFLVWVKSRDSWASLFFSIAAVSAAATSVCEMNMMHAPTPQVYDQLLRWSYVPTGLMVVSVAWFVRFYLRAGNIWLVWLLCVCRALILALTFMLDSSLHFREITSLRQIHFWGEIVVTPVGVANPWAYLANASTVLIIIISIDAAIAAWRRGDHRQAAVVGGTITGATVLGMMISVMLAAGMLRMPYPLNFVFLIIVLGMAYELSINLISAARLSSELYESRERMRLAAQAANLGVWEWDVIRDEIWVTEAIRSRLGLRENEHPNLDQFFQSLHPDDREATWRLVRKALEAGKEFQAEYRSITASGEIRWIAARGQVERGADGKPLRIRGVSIDITERKLTEEALRESERQLRAAQNLSHVGNWSWEVESDTVTWSAELYTIAGRDPTLPPPPYAEHASVFTRASWEKLRNAVDKALRLAEPYEVELDMVRPDGTVRHTLDHGVAIKDRAGRVVRLYGAVQDITERHDREAALHESESRFRQVADTAPVMIWMSGTDKLCNYFNKGWLDYTGRSLEQELGSGWTEGVHPDDFQRCLDIYTTSFDAHSAFVMQYRLRKHDGEYSWVLDNGVPRFAGDGQFLGYIGSCVDISVQKEAEELHRELAHVQRVSTMGLLASTLAHELNQPLGAILRNAEAGELFLQQNPPDYEELQAILADIKRDDQRASEVIDRMRLLLRRREPEYERLSIRELLDQVIVLAHAGTRACHVTPRIEILGELPSVAGDRVQVQQVMLNLLVNALDAMDGTPVERRRVDVIARRRDEQFVEVAVGDAGHGISAEHHARLFAPFHTTKPSGLGMGLTISRTIIESHGGLIWAENNPEGGATFRFTLRVSAPEADA